MAPLIQANQAQPGDTTKIRILGVCAPSPNNNYSLENVIEPIGEAKGYFQLFEKNQTVTATATTNILKKPEHGVLRLVTEADRGTLFGSTADPLDPSQPGYAYLPSHDYVGDDTATIQVDFGGGLKVQVRYYFQAMGHGLSDDWANDYCSEKGVYWKISSTLNPNGTSTITSVEYQSPTIDAGATSTDTAALASTLESSILSSFSVDPSIVTLNLADLPVGAVGQTIGTNITLDDNAAGNGWFIDTTPSDNSEYLPTSNPYEWVAKEGSAAYGKMDMLSVLLHEYGHALGIEHSADGHDYMATTPSNSLAPGVRRMPSAEELALMQELVAQAKEEMVATSDPFALSLSKGLSWFDKLTTNGSNDAPTPALPLQGGGGLPIPLGAGFGVAFIGRMRRSSYGGTSPSAELRTGIDFAGAPPVTQYAANATFANLSSTAGWNSQGSVDIASGTATLSEVSSSQTRIDAFLNLQADGTQRSADCVTCLRTTR
ncbi:MAG: matrixin family metalloprotease [Nitrosomonadales bacterium]|nr:matrixin family metalloprotease [Nitrosomonadales bacterium]